MKPKVFWSSIIILIISCVTFYILKEKEKELRINTQRQLVETIREKNTVENDLIVAVRAKEILEEELQQKERQIKLALDKVKEEIIARRFAEIQLITAMKEKRKLITRLEEFTQASKTVELKKIIIKAVPELVGKILVANKEQAFIVVDLGRENNLMLGDVLSVYRNGAFIGRVQIERVQEKVSAAAILPEWQDVEFKMNDEVRQI